MRRKGNKRRNGRNGTWTVGGLIALAFGLFLAFGSSPGSSRSLDDPGFHLLDHLGRPLSHRDLRGNPTLVFFGYTACPDVCPTALARMAAVLDGFGNHPGGPRAVFVTLDPERDSADRLAAYVSAFDSRILGVGGPREEVAAAAMTFRVYHRRVAASADGDYRIDHSAAIFLAGNDGRLRATFGPETEPEAIVAEIRRLVASRPSDDT
jgi:protein SCO1/2